MPGSILKIIAAVTMLIDHAGLILFPEQHWMRIVGRIAFPLFAYCIAEGYRYTRHRLRYFLQIFLLGIGCQIVYYIAERDWYHGILLTFSLSILLMELARRWRLAMQTADEKAAWLWGIALFAAILAVWGFTTVVTVDYGFVGILLPFLAYLPEKVGLRKDCSSQGFSHWHSTSICRADIRDSFSGCLPYRSSVRTTADRADTG